MRILDFILRYAKTFSTFIETIVRLNLAYLSSYIFALRLYKIINNFIIIYKYII